MDFSGLKIGYWPMSKLPSYPVDARNFLYYAKKRNIEFEIADPAKGYNVVVLSLGADLTVWKNYPRKKGKIIFLTQESYLATPKSSIKGHLRGLAKWAAREHKNLRFNYSRALQDMCKRADAVVCSTLEQKNDIQNYCKNVHIILDFHTDVVQEFKTDYTTGKPIKLVWEGFPENIKCFEPLRELLIELGKSHPISLHLITDLVHKKYMRKYWTLSTTQEIQSVFGKKHTFLNDQFTVVLHQWSSNILSRIVTGCDIAMIPLDLNTPHSVGKPENKLLLFWRMGMPVVVSATPAYTRAMEACGLDLYCKNNADWMKKLERLIIDTEVRKSAGTAGKQHTDICHSEKVYLSHWDQLFESVLK